MKRYILGCVLALAACDEAAMNASLGGGGGAASTGGSSGFREFLVIGSSMTFEQCRARGGLIIRDSGSPMIACDPNVIRAPVPMDEFDNPTSNAVASDT
jgi:hypothetical protein